MNKKPSIPDAILAIDFGGLSTIAILNHYQDCDTIICNT